MVYTESSAIREVTPLVDQEMLEAMSRMLDDRDKRLSDMVHQELAPIKVALETTNVRLARIEGSQECTLKWLDRVEQRLIPVADYVETMHLSIDK